MRIDPPYGTIPETVNYTLVFGCTSGPWHYEFNIWTYTDTDGDGLFDGEPDDTLTGNYYQDVSHTKFALIQYNSPVEDSISLTDAAPDFYLFEFIVASHGGTFHTGDGPWIDSAYQQAAFYVSGVEIPDYEMALNFPENPPTTVQIQNGTASKAIDAWVTNIGSKDLNEVNISLLDDSDALADAETIQDIPVDGVNQKSVEMIFAVPQLIGSYDYKIRGNYTNETPTPTDDLTRWYNFTVQVVAELLEAEFIIGTVVLLQNPIGTGTTTTLQVDVENTGDIEVRLGVWTSYDSDDLLIIPDIEITVPSLNLSEVRTFDFYVRGLAGGDHIITIRAALADETGSIITTDAFREKQVILSVISIPEVITLTPDDIGPNDAILQGKIETLGGFDVARVYFIVWETADPTTAVQAPRNGERVTYVSNFRIYIDWLDASTNYTVSLRLIYSGGEVEGGDVLFSTPAVYSDPLTGLRNTLGLATGLGAINMGLILGMAVMGLAFVVFAMVTRNPIAMLFPGIGSIAFNVTVGWWPSWTLIVIALLIAVLIGKILPLAGGSGE